MATFSMRDIGYNTLSNECTQPQISLVEAGNASSVVVTHDPEHEDATNVIIHRVPQTKGGWTHIEDLDSFFTRMYKYYIKGGFYPMVISDCFLLLQFVFVVWFSTFLVYCLNYPVLFREDPNFNRTTKITLNDVIYPTSVCVNKISWQWWCIIVLCGIIFIIRLVKCAYYLFYAYDTKLFYNQALKIKDSDLGWINWRTVQNKAREAQLEHHMCVHKQEINELDIYHRILRFNNYLVAMINKNLLPLQITLPIIGEFHYMSKGLKYNLELLLFFGPWSPWENCWQLRESYKDYSKRLVLARQLEKHILLLAFLNLLLSPVIQAWQILYFFFSYAELIKRSPASFGSRTWSLYARIALRHFNELEHELQDRLTRAHKPASKYLASFSSPVTEVIAKNITFLAASVLGVLVALSVYDEDVLTVEHVLTIITILGCIVAGARALMGEEEECTACRSTRGEELLVQVLGHVHYLPAAWRGRAHTARVAAHFQHLFHFRAVYLLFELVSPIFCPLVLYSLRSKALDIVDFYRNFTVSVLGIGDVCSFAQLDVRKHGNPDWQSPLRHGDSRSKMTTGQYEQGEGGKTELSLVAFSCRNPTWQPQPSQRQFLRSLRQSMQNVTHPAMHKTMLGSYIQQSLVYGSTTPLPAVLSFYQQRPQFRLPDMDETSDEDEEKGDLPEHGDGVSTLDPDRDETRDMSVSTLHLYDLHLSQQAGQSSTCCPSNCSQRAEPAQPRKWATSEDTPLLRKP